MSKTGTFGPYRIFDSAEPFNRLEWVTLCKDQDGVWVAVVHPSERKPRKAIPVAKFSTFKDLKYFQFWYGGFTDNASIRPSLDRLIVFHTKRRLLSLFPKGRFYGLNLVFEALLTLTAIVILFAGYKTTAAALGSWGPMAGWLVGIGWGAVALFIRLITGGPKQGTWAAEEGTEGTEKHERPKQGGH